MSKHEASGFEAVTVDPDRFRVPYAMSGADMVLQLKDGRPDVEEMFCPLCRGRVSFVTETDERAAHFRHIKASDCDKLAEYHKNRLHDIVVNAAESVLRTHGASSIVSDARGQEMPKGRIATEETQRLEGRAYRPDIVVHPAEGQKAPVLELEVVLTHEPTPKRLEVAARNGRLIGRINIKSLEKQYYQKLWRSEQWDIPEAAREFVMDKRFKIMGKAHIRRTVTGVLNRIYLKATVKHHKPQRAAAGSLQAQQGALQAQRWTRPEPAKKSALAHIAGLTPVTPQIDELLPVKDGAEKPICAICGKASWGLAPGKDGGPMTHYECWINSKKRG